jgi:excisionase family DNA binding protein
MIRVSRPPQARKPQPTGSKSEISCDYYDLKTAAAKLGISYWTAHASISAGGMPNIQIGGRYRIPKSYIDGLPDAAIAEFNSKAARQ